MGGGQSVPRKVKSRSTWRATFAGYRPRPDQLAVRIPGHVTLEVFEPKLGNWEARYHPSGVPLVADEACQSRESACEMVRRNFERQITPWLEFDKGGNWVPPEEEVTVNA